MPEALMKKIREEEIPAPPSKLTGVKIIKVAEIATKRAQENAVRAAEEISNYLEKAGARKIPGVKDSELGRILFE